jgi:hypothetical protein
MVALGTGDAVYFLCGKNRIFMYYPVGFYPSNG